MKQNDISNGWHQLFTGLGAPTPTLNGNRQTYINLDNAASTPSFASVQAAVNGFLTYYSSVHRGTGFKSQLSTHAYEQARQITLEFLGADQSEYTCIFGKNTTEALNKLARRFPFTENRDIVLTSGMEHHSNDLPWRAWAKTIHISLSPEGALNETEFEVAIREFRDRLALVAITGASNVTGTLNPIYRLAEQAHAVGGMIAVDCAQLAPHRKIEMGRLDDPAHLDFVSISAHKMYAPFGTGALIGRRDIFERGDPDMVGGGTVDIVTLDDVVWAGPPDRDEAGSPNTVGAVALAIAIRQLQAIGMERVAAHETELTSHALRELASVPGIHIYGDRDPERAHQRLGVIPFKLEGRSHFLVSAVLGYEFGIGVRSGCFCAHPYILHLLGLTPEEASLVRERMQAGDKSDMPGLVRVSFGLYNRLEEVDALVEALHRIILGEYEGEYKQDRSSGEFTPQKWQPDFEAYFSFDTVL
jgi:selenocysteine lyase/cysteine desulfurase